MANARSRPLHYTLVLDIEVQLSSSDDGGLQIRIKDHGGG